MIALVVSLSILCIGDSITAPPSSWCGRQPGATNVAIGGAQASGWIGPFYSIARAELPIDVAVVMLGTNESYRLVAPAVYRANLEELVARLLGDGAGQVRIVSPPSMPIHDPRLLIWNALLLSYSRTNAATCAVDARVVCGPDFFGLLEHGIDYLGDEIHPNALGQDKMAGAFEAVLAVPEPATLLLVAVGLVLLGVGRKRLNAPAGEGSYPPRKILGGLAPTNGLEPLRPDPEATEVLR